MAKNTLGGKRTNVAAAPRPGVRRGMMRQQPVVSQQATQATQQQTGGGIAAFQAMTDQQKAAAVLQAMNAQRTKITFGAFAKNAPDTVFQKFADMMGIDNAPQLVSDAQLDAMPGNDMFRSVHGSGWMDTDDIVANTMLDDKTFYSDSGGSVYGRGVYFATGQTQQQALKESVYWYGRSPYSAVMRAKYNSNVKSVSYHSILSDVNREINSRTAFGRALSRVPEDDRVSIMACAKGYNAVTATNGYQVIIDRSCISISSTHHRITNADIKSAGSGTLKWKNMK